MNNNFLTYFEKLLKPPPDLKSEFYRAYIGISVMAPSALVMHALFIIIFLLFGETILAYFNCVSVGIYIIIIFLNHYRRFKTAIGLYFIETTIFVFLCVYYIGTNAGFQYYIFIFIIAIVFVPSKQKIFKALFSIIIGLILCAIFYYSMNYKPIHNLPHFVLYLLSFYNIMSVIISSTAGLLFMMSAVEKAEAYLEHEFQRSEFLLLNILPKQIADRLKVNSGTIADKFSICTILFADIVGFTSLSKKLSPEKLIDLLNNIFTRFDELVEYYDVEKIKTIGDAYMIAAGIPKPMENNAEIIAELSLDMMKTIDKYRYKDGTTLQIRIGIHSGEVIAGVIGKKKFAYDLWGDAVNVASRMESNSSPGKILVSEFTYYLLKEKYLFSECCPLNVKGRGAMNGYFLYGKI